METVSDATAFPVELTRLEGWEDYISQFEESEHEPLWAYIKETVWVDGLPIEKLPSVDIFRWRYLGKWDSFEDFALEYALTCDFVGELSDVVISYFDIARYARDLIDDFYVIDAPGFGVWVYRVE